MAAAERRRAIRRLLIVATVTSIVFTVACWPTTRFVGVNFIVSKRTLPLWVKAADFIDRDLNLAQTAQSVLGHAGTDEDKAAAAFAWTRANIRRTPDELPVIDDHIWHVIVRGYGESDQQADVFTTLLVYGGVRAYWLFVGTPPDEIPISYVWIGDRWRVYDVSLGVMFRNAHGAPATPEELAANPELIRASVAPVLGDAEGYVAHFKGYAAPVAPDVLRADLQMPRRRLWHETRKLFGMQGREWPMRQRAAEEGRAQ